MEAERSGGVAGGTNQNSGGSGVGRNPNGPKSVLGQATTAAAAAAGAMAGSSQPREPQDGDAGLSLPGILHFIQFEWGRFQTEKYRWEAERDELRVITRLLFSYSYVDYFVTIVACYDLEEEKKASLALALFRSHRNHDRSSIVSLIRQNTVQSVQNNIHMITHLFIPCSRMLARVTSNNVAVFASVQNL